MVCCAHTYQRYVMQVRRQERRDSCTHVREAGSVVLCGEWVQEDTMEVAPPHRAPVTYRSTPVIFLSPFGLTLVGTEFPY